MAGVLVTSEGARWFGGFGQHGDTRGLIDRYTKMLIEDHFEKGLYRPSSDQILGSPIAILDVHLDKIIYEKTNILIDVSNDNSLARDLALIDRETYPNSDETNPRSINVLHTKVEKFTFKSAVTDFIEHTHTDTSVVTVDLKAGATIGIIEAEAGINIKNTIEDRLTSSIKQETVESSETTTTEEKAEKMEVPPATVYSFPHYVRTVSGVAPQKATFTFDVTGRIRFSVQTLGIVHQWVPFILSGIVPDPSQRRVLTRSSFEFEAVIEEIFPREVMSLSEWKEADGVFPGLTDKVQMEGEN